MRRGEDALTAWLAARAARGPGQRVGIGDDAAVVDLPKGRYVFTADTLVEGIDFLRGESPVWIGRRAAAANLSDLAAMGARPLGFLLSIALPPGRGAAYARRLLSGALARIEAAGAVLWGGDLSRGPAVSVTALAVGRARHPVTRAGARPGDLVFVTGRPGAARRGLARRLRRAGAAPTAEELPYLDPPVPLELARRLSERRLVSAMMDLSDGIGLDLGRLAGASGVRIELDEVDERTLRESGDDFELLFTAAPGKGAKIAAAGRESGTIVRKIGKVRAGRGVVWVSGRSKRRIDRWGYDHLTRGGG